VDEERRAVWASGTPDLAAELAPELQRPVCKADTPLEAVTAVLKGVGVDPEAASLGLGHVRKLGVTEQIGPGGTAVSGIAGEQWQEGQGQTGAQEAPEKPDDQLL